MSDAAAILRFVYGHGAAKKIARKFNVSPRTGKAWLAGLFPESRTQELAAVVRAELDLIDARNSEIRKQLGIASGGAVEADGEIPRGAPVDAVVAPGAVASGVGRDVNP